MSSCILNSTLALIASRVCTYMYYKRQQIVEHRSQAPPSFPSLALHPLFRTARNEKLGGGLGTGLRFPIMLV